MNDTASRSAMEGPAGQAEGRRRRDRVVDHIALKRRYRVRCLTRFVVLTALAGRTVTADDVRRHFTKLLAGTNGNILGATFRIVGRLGLIRVAGSKTSDVASNQGHRLLIWELADEAKAREWLNANPALEDPDRKGTLFTADDFVEAN